MKPTTKSPNRAWRTVKQGAEIVLIVLCALGLIVAILAILGAFIFTVRCAWEAGAA